MDIKRQCCKYCGKPLSDNQLVKDAYTNNSIVAWAKIQLKILADMADDRNLEWFADEVKRIGKELRTLKY